mgnify:CR=1 FL=1
MQKLMRLLNWPNLRNLALMLLFLSLMLLAWIAPSWFISPASILFIIGTIIVVVMVLISYRSVVLQWKKFEEDMRRMF